MKASEILFRPSELYKIMTNPRSKAAEVNGLPNLSEGCKTHLKHKYIEAMYGRSQEIDSKYMKKGREVEEDAITLYSLIKGRAFVNNSIRVQNAYLNGEIDLPHFNSDKVITEITDIKSSYNAHTFIDNLGVIKPANEWQGHGYMMLHTDCQRYNIANVLVNNTEAGIMHELYREGYKWGDDLNTPVWREIEIIKGLVYDKDSFDRMIDLRGCYPVDDKSKAMYNSFIEIPAEARLIEHTFNRDEAKLDAIRERIEACREWMRIMFKLEK